MSTIVILYNPKKIVVTKKACLFEAFALISQRAL